MWDSPGMVAGRGRFTTEFLEAGRGRWIGKEGAEGVYAIGLAARKGEKALGIAFKLEDGSTRARDAVALDVLARLDRLPGSARRRLSRRLSPILRNVRGLAVGSIEADVPLKVYRKLL
jgi:L-asparaginase II